MVLSNVIVDVTIPRHSFVFGQSDRNSSSSPIQDYVHPGDQTQPTFEMTPGFKPFTMVLLLLIDVKYFRLSGAIVFLSLARTKLEMAKRNFPSN